MTIAARIKKLLDTYKLAYRVFPHKRVSSLSQAAVFLQIDPTKVLTCQIVADEQGMLLIVYPLSNKINFERLHLLLNRHLKIVPAIKANRIFSDCDAGCWPPIGHTYAIEVLIDRSVAKQGVVYFSSGSSNSLLQMHVHDFLYMNSRARLLDLVTTLHPEDSTSQEPAIHDLDSLCFPELPTVALQILQLSISSEHSTQDLIDLISKDQLIQDQLRLYTQLPFLQSNKSQGQSNSVEDIVQHVLGFDMVSHIALGVAAGRAFNVQQTPADTTEFWRHAFYAATYAQRITQLVSKQLQLDPAISYLAGLFHNFGLLLFSQLFPPEYRLLKKWMKLNPKLSIAVLEKRLLGMGQAFNIVRGGHAQMGESLLRYWRMPEAICVIAKEHHSLLYKGKYSEYVKIIQITNQLLREDGVGDGSSGGINEQLLEPLGLTAQQVIDSVKDIRAGSPGLDEMARSITN